MSCFRHDLDTAVKEYKRIANKYNVTPLQLELMLGIVKNERKDLLEECIKVTSKVHGAIRTRVTLLAAFAESELQAPIRKLLLVRYCKITKTESILIGFCKIYFERKLRDCQQTN